MPDPTTKRRRQPLRRLPVRVFLFLMAAGVLRVMVIGAFTIAATTALFDGFMEHGLPLAARRAAQGLDATLAGARAEIARLALDDTLREAVRRPHAPGAPAGDALRAALGEALERSSFCAGLTLSSVDGAVWLALGAPLPAGSPPSAPDPGEESALTMLPLGEGRAAPAVSSVVRDPDGRPAALLHGMLHEGGVSALLPDNPLHHLGVHYLILGRDGRPIHGARERAADARTGLELDALDPGRDPVMQSYTADRGDMLASAVALQHFDGILVTETRSDAAIALGRSLIARIFLADLCFFAVLALTGYWITSRVVRPVEKLSEGARRISAGDLEGEVPERGTSDEIGLLTRTFNAMTRKLRQDQQEIERAHRRLMIQNQELHRANEVLAQLSITDGLTKLHNHRYFQDHLTREIKRVMRTSEPLSMLLADLDDFKRLNDRLGHAAGDELLVRIAQIMNASVRESDLLARYGGEEFVVLATGTELSGACHLAEKIRTAVAETPFILDESMRPTTVTLSIGVAQYRNDRKAFFIEADRALYRAKAEGKNCVMAASAEL